MTTRVRSRFIRRSVLRCERLEDRLTPSTLISVPTRRDHIYDAARQLLYITTSGGMLQRYDMAGQQLLTPFAVGGPLAGLDLTPDGAFAYVADTQYVGSQAFVRKVNLDTGAVTGLGYTRQGGEGGPWDIAITNTGRAIFDGMYEGSGWVPMRQIDLATDTVSIRGDVSGGVRQNTHIHRGLDRSRFFITESNISSGPILSYDAVANTFPRRVNTSAYYDDAVSAVSRDGSLIAVELGYGPSFNFGTTVMDRDFNAVRSLGQRWRGGLAFDPNYDLLYAVDSTAGIVTAFDTNTWAEQFQISIGETYADSRPFGNGVLTVSDDSTKLFLSTPSGVRVLDLPSSFGVASRFVFSYPRFTGQGVANAFWVTAVDAWGYAVADYQGTVRFTSTDGSATLPKDYTFTADEYGSHLFEATFGGVGIFSLTARDLGNPNVTATQTGIRVHDGTAASVLPVSGRRAHVTDPYRGLLYITTSTGLVERYDPTTRTLLTPWTLGGSLNGLDISPDGAYLYVTQGDRSAVQALVHKIGIDDGSVTTLNYNIGGGESGGWGIAVADNGKALFTSRYEGSGGVQVRQIDLSTGAISNRRGSTQDTHVVRSLYRNLLFFTGSNISSGPIFTYDADTDTFPRSTDTWAYYDDAVSAVNRDGSLIAMELGYGPSFNYGTTVMDRNFNAVRSLGQRWRGGLAFDPNYDLLYAVDSTAGIVTAFDTNTWAEQFQLSLGETYADSRPFGNGVLTVSDDSTKLFLSVTAGVRVLNLPSTFGVASRFVFSYPRFTGQGVANAFWVTAVDAWGYPVLDYTGTVRFTSTDGSATLPKDYTFTADEYGSHLFEASFGSVGTFSLTARDLGDPSVTATQTGIAVHNGVVSLIPVSARRDHVYDPYRGLLYISMASGLVERYDVATQTLLTPWVLGGSLNGLDISPDGAYLYVTQSDRSAVQALVHKIGIDDGSVTTLNYAIGGYEGGGWGLAIAGNGKAFFTSRFEGSGGVQLRQIDLTTDAISNRRGINQNTHATRGLWRNLLFFAESNISSGPVFTYDADTDTFPRSASLGFFHSQNLSAVSWDSLLIALEILGDVRIYDPQLGLLRTLSGLNGGIAFGAYQDVFYAARTSTSRIHVYDTTTWTELFSLPVGEAVGDSQPFANGEMTVSDDGLWLFISTNAGVRIVSLLGSGPAPGRGFGLDVSALTPAEAVRYTPSVEPTLFRAEMPPAPAETRKAQDVVWQEVSRSESPTEPADWLSEIAEPLFV